jgi:hypothetical protein
MDNFTLTLIAMAVCGISIVALIALAIAITNWFMRDITPKQSFTAEDLYRTLFHNKDDGMDL